MKAIGHGRPEDMSDLAALDIAREAEPRTPERADPNDPMGLEVGERVGVAPASGGPIFSGTVHSVSADEIALMREDERIGRVCTHFPRIGYRVTRPYLPSSCPGLTRASTKTSHHAARRG